MKKTLTLTVLSAFALAVMAQEQQMDDERLKGLILRQLCSGRVPYMEAGAPIRPLPTAESIAKAHNISNERMTKVLEEIVRENLPAIKNGTGRTLNVFPLIQNMQIFHGTNTVALLKECMATPLDPIHDSIFRDAVETYVVIAGAESIPFFREAIENKRLDEKRRSFVYVHLEIATDKLKEKNKTDDVEKINAFIKEMRQAE